MSHVRSTISAAAVALAVGVAPAVSAQGTARSLGIDTVYQDLALVPTLSVAHNMFLKREVVSGWGPFKMLNNPEMRRRARKSIESIGIGTLRSVGSEVAMLSGGQRRRVDLAVVSVPTRDLASVVIDVAHRGAHGMVVLTGTDFRVGDNRTIINLARAYGVRALGPDALGLINTAHEIELNATPGPMPRPGGVGRLADRLGRGVGGVHVGVREQRRDLVVAHIGDDVGSPQAPAHDVEDPRDDPVGRLGPVDQAHVGQPVQRAAHERGLFPVAPAAQ